MTDTRRPTAKKIIGLHGSAAAWLLSAELQDTPKAVVVCADRKEVEELVDDLAFFRSSRAILLFPSCETLPLEPVSPGVDVSSQRIRALDRILRADSFVVVTSADALVQRLIPPDYIKRLTRTVRVGERLNREQLVQNLLDGGFQPTRNVSNVGDMCVKGDHRLPIERKAEA